MRGYVNRGVASACPERKLIAAIIQQALQDAQRDPDAAEWLDTTGVAWCVLFLGFDECRAAAWRDADLRARPPLDEAEQREKQRIRSARRDARKRAARSAM